MSPAIEAPVKPQLPWVKLAWFGALIIACYLPILKALVTQWSTDEDMSHGFFVPLIVGYIVWKKRDELMATKPEPSMWGVLLMGWGAIQMMLGVLGTELFTSRTAFVISLIGLVWALGGKPFLRKLAFPLFLLFLMVPIPAVIYNQITFPLQIIASKFAEWALDAMNIPVLREGNILNVAGHPLSVVEACSGIRSLLTLTFLALVYGYFFDRHAWVRVALFLSVIPVAILANGSRVTITGVLTVVKPELAEGFFHEATGMFLFLADFVILVFAHQMFASFARWIDARKASR
ncbi:MAG TPA: exosortase/archaeosortase family protein [Bryobacteraceae bacterium]|jgi:exosortase|nr:exosortase/archaeosortase family protein [Bryobacteraceae bacterium]